MFAAQKQWDMLRQWLGRNGVDGNGRSFPGKVGLNDLNAYWDGGSVTIGHNSANEWIAGIDVVGHEYGHAIDTNTPGGTSGQEAGLGEGTGDIFGALTEAYANEPAPYDTPDYTVGEMINLQGRGPIRNMYNPSAVNNDPSCYSSSIPSTEVHAAAGPLNHWFYLLAEGSSPGGGKPSSSTCNQSTVTGVGVQNAGKIFYGGMLLKTSSMSYKKYRTATLSSAKTLDASCDLFNKTKAAWDAISVPAQSGDPACTPSGQGDFSLTLNPASGSVQQGASVTTTVATSTTTGQAQQVTLSASGLPAGVTASFSPATVQSGQSSTLTLTASSTTAPGPATVTVKGQGASLAHTADYALTVGGGQGDPTTPPDISAANVQAHLNQLGTIATQNGGNRRAGSGGHTQSLAYIKGKLQAAGYTVTEQNCTSCTYPSNNLIADWPGGPKTRRDVRRPPRQRLRRPGHQRQRLRLRDPAGERAGPGPEEPHHDQARALRLVDRRGTGPQRLEVLRGPARQRPARRHQGLLQLRHGRLAQRRLLHQQPELHHGRAPEGVLDLAEPRPRGEHRGPGPQ